jgi:hypothetical protein
MEYYEKSRCDNLSNDLFILRPEDYSIILHTHRMYHLSTSNKKIWLCPLIKNGKCCGNIYQRAKNTRRSLKQHVVSNAHKVDERIIINFLLAHDKVEQKNNEINKKTQLKLNFSQSSQSNKQKKMEENKQLFLSSTSCGISKNKLLAIEQTARRTRINLNESIEFNELVNQIMDIIIEKKFKKQKFKHLKNVLKYLFLSKNKVENVEYLKYFDKWEKLYSPIFSEFEEELNNKISKISTEELSLFLFDFGQNNSHAYKNYFRRSLKSSIHFDKLYPINTIKMEEFLDDKKITYKKNDLMCENIEENTNILDVFIDSNFIQLVCVQLLCHKQIQFANMKQEAQKYFNNLLLNKSETLSKWIKNKIELKFSSNSKSNELLEYCKNMAKKFLISKGIEFDENFEVKSNQSDRFNAKLSCSSPYPICLFVVGERPSSTLFKFNFLNEDGKLISSNSSLFRHLLQLYCPIIKFPANSSTNINKTIISGSSSNKSPSKKKQNRTFPSLSDQKMYQSEIVNKKTKTEGWTTKKIGNSSVLSICDLGKFLVNKITPILKSKAVTYFNNKLTWYFLIGIDGANACTRFFVQALASLSPKSTDVFQHAWNINSKKFYQSERIAFVQMNETSKNMANFLPEIQSQIKKVSSTFFQVTINGMTTLNKFVLGGLKVDKKCAHETMGTCGPKASYSSTFSICPRKYVGHLPKEFTLEDVGCINYDFRTPISQYIQLLYAKKNNAEDWSTLSLKGPQQIEGKVFCDILHFISNHILQVCILILAYIPTTKRDQFIKDIAETIGIARIKFPSTSKEVRRFLAAISTLLNDKKKQKYYFGNDQNLGELIRDCALHYSSLIESLYSESKASNTGNK